ncbi:gamma-glutamyl-gamma-aminobutyrate hydrolase family protein [Rubrimonas cliftonensis]|uniref:Putative glutamine amidotransferase n=1 Tax=Rubrimonas cliftonensis TaxID=89524 RepID=A0A1H3VI94_9RHOB|nr:gamma-glutamyl-gamma-aminobutyrate hydrolase family protein [Rubrimonas cliftonensis]SDZ74495.1 putative glutamine amidotransferase [Rubrimonas cliftonensis]
MAGGPLIGVTGPRGRGWALWVGAVISLWLQGARARRIAPPLDPATLDGLDGLLIGGGDDVSAELYGGQVRPNVRLDPERDALELAALARFWDTGRPILGICRGSQMINVYRGGALHRDVKESFNLTRHPRTPLALKTVAVCEGTRLAEAIGLEKVRVNSLHSQAVDRLGAGIRVGAHDEHGMIQAVEAEGAPFRVGVQWHPELLFYKRPHRRLFRAFVKAARERGADG